jgi:hypothetical protein
MRKASNILVGKPEGKRPWDVLGVVGRIILKCNLWKHGGKMWTGFIWLRIGTDVELL